MIPQIFNRLTEHWATVIFALAATYLTMTYVYAHLRLRDFPGPALASFSYLWLASNFYIGRQSDVFHKAIKQYRATNNPFVRIGPNDLITDSPDVVRRISAARSTYRRSSWYRALKLDPWGDSMLSTCDTAHHDRLKAQVGKGYAGKENNGMEAAVNKQVLALVELLERKYMSEDGAGVFRPVDLATVIQFFTLDAITQLAYGQAFGFVASDSDVHGYMAATKKALPRIVLAAEVPFVGDFCFSSWFSNLFGPSPKDRSGIGKIIGVAQKVVAERFGPEAKDHPDMLGSFVRHGLSQNQCESEVMLQILAGSDTTATALRGTMMRLCSTPKAYYKLQKEIDEAVQSGMVGEGVISDETAKRLPYLQAVIYEGMRLEPPFTGLLMKEVPPGGDEINGVFIPGGVRVGVSAKSLQMQKDLYGHDADVFRPERWIDCDNATRLRMKANTELVFGYGRWMCAGKNVAFMELNKVYFELLRRFDFQVVDPKQPAKQMNHNIVFCWDMFVKVTRRCP